MTINSIICCCALAVAVQILFIQPNGKITCSTMWLGTYEHSVLILYSKHAACWRNCQTRTGTFSINQKWAWKFLSVWPSTNKQPSGARGSFSTLYTCQHCHDDVDKYCSVIPTLITTFICCEQMRRIRRGYWPCATLSIAFFFQTIKRCISSDAHFFLVCQHLAFTFRIQLTYFVDITTD